MYQRYNNIAVKDAQDELTEWLKEWNKKRDINGQETNDEDQLYPGRRKGNTVISLETDDEEQVAGSY